MEFFNSVDYSAGMQLHKVRCEEDLKAEQLTEPVLELKQKKIRPVNANEFTKAIDDSNSEHIDLMPGVRLVGEERYKKR